ncbi:MAG: DUF4430 domain-containing protein [Propionibacteriaceae bacterium]|nr:DUF4430 domain-containing protein [Propionibacteriaceae bacterium]
MSTTTTTTTTTTAAPTLHVTLSIDCLTAAGTKGCPANGWILNGATVEFTAGETVFDVLKRETRSRGIHMASRYTPAYNSAYIECISNICEFDGGRESGWMYSVNGWYPNYGASRYELQNGDVIKWRYTCSLGKDIGGGNALG